MTTTITTIVRFLDKIHCYRAAAALCRVAYQLEMAQARRRSDGPSVLIASRRGHLPRPY